MVFIGFDLIALKSYRSIKKSICFTQNVSKYWVSGSFEQRQRIQKLVFPEGLVIDTEKRQYRTSKVNTLFAVKLSFSNDKKDIKKGLPINSDEESFVVAGVGLNK